MRLDLSRHLLLKCLYKARMMSCHVFACYGCRFRTFLPIVYQILEMFQQCGIFLFSFYFDDLSIRFQKYSDSVVFFVFHYILDTLRKSEAAKWEKGRQHNGQKTRDKNTNNPWQGKIDNDMAAVPMSGECWNEVTIKIQKTAIQTKSGNKTIEYSDNTNLRRKLIHLFRKCNSIL